MNEHLYLEGRDQSPSKTRPMPKYSILLLFALLAGFSTINVSAQQYEVGDIVENFTLINRANGQEVSLYDMEGKVVFLEWFAQWCVFCQAAAADIGPGIVDYYGDLGGNPNDVEVMHVAINLQGGQETQTQNFINQFSLGLVLNDFNRAVSNRFQPSNQPIFAIISGVANSPSHQQWELLFSRLGYLDFNTPIATFRSVIDSVAGPSANPPVITTQPTAQTIESGSELSLSVVATSEEMISYQWKHGDADIAGATEATFTLPNIQEADAGQYSVTVTTASGSVESDHAFVEIILGFLDSLIAQGVPENQRALGDDPDKDGVPNGLEFLSRTDASDPGSARSPISEIMEIDNAMYLVFSYTADPSISSISPEVQFSGDLAFATDFLSPVLISETDEGDLTRYTYRAQSGLETTPQFARLSASPTGQ